MGCLLAWIVETPGELGIIAAFVARGTTREPARRRFSSAVEARSWVWAQANAFGATVVWTDEAPAIADEAA